MTKPATVFVKMTKPATLFVKMTKPATVFVKMTTIHNLELCNNCVNKALLYLYSNAYFTHLLHNLKLHIAVIFTKRVSQVLPFSIQ